MKVFVYFNLHRKLWSVKALEGSNKGRVIAHSQYVVLTDVKAKVSEAGRQRVINSKQKNVHAGIVGELFTTDIPMFFSTDTIENITYNPYKYNTFVYKNSEEPFEGSEYAYLNAPDRTVRVWG